jgi:hypothetical protein
MQQTLITIMAAMMPYMKLIVFVGAGILAFGLVVGIIARVSGFGGGFNGLCYKLALAVGVFFLACEGVGRLLGMEPTVVFGDIMNRVLYSNQWPFWSLGIMFLVGSLIVRKVSDQH